MSSSTRRLAALTPIAALVVAGGVATAAPAHASVWDQLAQCESGGDWSINTGNGYYGGLQFSLSSWRAVGGSGYPHQASKSEQIARAERLQDLQGWGAWPACSAELGLTGDPAPQPQPESQSEPEPEPASEPAPDPEPETQPVSNTGATYEVQPGDTLSEIAAERDTSAGHLADMNGLSNPDLIYVGDQLDVSGHPRT